MWTVAKLAYKELVSKKIFLATLLMSAAYLVLYGVVMHYAARDFLDSRAINPAYAGELLLQAQFLGTQLVGIGLYLASSIVVLLSILGSVGSLSGEIESRHIDTLLARPLSRRSVVLGKFAGLAGMLAAYAAVMYLSVLLLNRWLGGEFLGADLALSQAAKGLALFVLIPVLIVAVALWLSSRTSTIVGGVILIVLQGMASIGGFVEQFGSLANNESLTTIGIVTSLLFPTDAVYRKMTVSLFTQPDDPISFVSQGLFATSSPPSNAMIAYAVLYALASLLLAVRTFSKRDV